MTARQHVAHAQPIKDPDLLLAVAAGDLGALGELYDRYAREVWRAVRRSVDGAADVEDIVHATFLALPRIAASYDGRANCRNWLCGIGVHLALRQRRGSGRFRRMLGTFAQTVSGRSTRHPEREASNNEELLSLERALAGLSDKKRAVFVLVELEYPPKRRPRSWRSPPPPSARVCSMCGANSRARWSGKG
jgi:RNA polymerase sigma-70 factor (ECF subfamily)